MRSPDIEVLYFDGCPGYDRLRAELGRYPELRYRPRNDARTRGYSSPSVFVDGELRMGTRLADRSEGSCTWISDEKIRAIVADLARGGAGARAGGPTPGTCDGP